MSKLLAMMMKKQEYLYPVIKGSLTENDGVFSGFSDSNYLQLLSPYTQQNNIEIKFKFTTSSNITTTQYICSWASDINGTIRSCGLYINNYGRYGCLLREDDDTNHQINGGYVSANTTYFIKMIFDVSNKSLKLGISTDDINYTYEVNTTFNNNLAYMDAEFNIGRARPNNYYFTGSIDLNQSYIKIANTKYQLQAVVGYTVVGSPTIVDGVASGFTSENYLQIPALDWSKDIDYVLKYSYDVNETIFRNCFLGRSGYTSLQLHGSNDGNNIGFYFGGISYNWNGCDFKNYQYLRLNKVGNVITLYLGNSTDNWLINKQVTITPTTIVTYTALGQMASGLTSNSCQIDLNSTYIKVNNKLWFNGQPAS